ncbi:response regulator transcription factor [Pseudonocardia nematodicida]|uniref:Response regulator transcription factor n=1 Tax=Pseudonocardia nematodicida TaxID=1206997 RepID=A0ABV1KID2_9PSEU
MDHILIAEDEEHIARFVGKGLRAHHFHTTVVADGQDAVAHAATGRYALLVLDLGLPGVDGYAVLRALREARNPIPIIILTARDGVRDTVAGLEGGADDYMTKPFRFEELLARVRLRLRTSGNGQGEASVLSVDGVTLDLRTRRATVAEKSVDLSTREFALLELMMRHPGQVLSREQILDRVWGFDFDPGSNVVDVYVRQLRRKIGAERITTVRGVGYRCG